jgi:hypothetical protein
LHVPGDQYHASPLPGISPPDAAGFSGGADPTQHEPPDDTKPAKKRCMSEECLIVML